MNNKELEKLEEFISSYKSYFIQLHTHAAHLLNALKKLIHHKEQLTLQLSYKNPERKSLLQSLQQTQESLIFTQQEINLYFKSEDNHINKYDNQLKEKISGLEQTLEKKQWAALEKKLNPFIHHNKNYLHIIELLKKPQDTNHNDHKKTLMNLIHQSNEMIKHLSKTILPSSFKLQQPMAFFNSSKSKYKDINLIFKNNKPKI